jgi:hypothetical protein
VGVAHGIIPQGRIGSKYYLGMPIQEHAHDARNAAAFICLAGHISMPKSLYIFLYGYICGLSRRARNLRPSTPGWQKAKVLAEEALNMAVSAWGPKKGE